MRKTASAMLGSVLILLTLGIVMLYSTSSTRAVTLLGDSLFYVKRQAVWLLLGSIACVAATYIDYSFWKRLALPLVVLCAIGLALTVWSPLGVDVNGSTRWLKLGIKVQPSEFTKLAVIMGLSWWLAKVRWHVEDFVAGLVKPIIPLGVILLLIMLEPDYGTTMLIAVVAMSIMFVAGTRFIYLLVSGLIGLTGFVFAIMMNPERMSRVMSFLDPEKYAQDDSFQLMNALYAIALGGGWGVGLGESIQKRWFLPEAHTDFIFAIVAEELGMGVTLLIVFLFVVFLVCGLQICFRAPDDFGKLMAFGMTMMIVLQAAINIGVVTGCLPTKGLPLPFISFGGSSMLVTMTMVGILINISRHAVDEKEMEMKAIRDRRHRF